MSRSPRPPGSAYARAFDEPARGLGRIRAVATPLVVLLVLAAARPGGEAWRIGALAGLLAVILAWSAVELVTIRRGRHDAELFRRGLLGLLIVLPVLVALSGGSSSPLTPALLPAALGANFLFPNVAGRLVTLALLAILWGTAAVAHGAGGEALVLPVLRAGAESKAAIWADVLFLSLFMLAGSFGGRHFRAVFERVVELTAERNRAVLEGQRERTRALAALSSEIAHELKNPLATVKGLAALVAKDATGKAAERVAVLRREVDRMQAVLDELLNFSRPLSPLSLDRVAPSELLGEVARLHEGMAAQSGVTVGVDPGAEPCEEVRCDRRKVLQALVNLVQNAIEASPRGGRVTLRAEAAGGGEVRLSVEDEGPGVPEEIRARVFEPGVTSKRTGSGLGLTIARALARQHGGDVALDRGARGTVASVVLPADGPRSSDEEGAIGASRAQAPAAPDGAIAEGA